MHPTENFCTLNKCCFYALNIYILLLGQGWAWVECKEGKVDVARELFQRAISVDSRTLDAVRAFQVLFWLCGHHQQGFKERHFWDTVYT